MRMDLERTKDLYETLARASKFEPNKELAMGKLFGYAEVVGDDELRSIVETVGGKALMRAGATEFKESPPPDGKQAQIQDELSPEDIEMVPRERIYVYSYEMSSEPTDEESHSGECEVEDQHKGDLSSVYTMYVEDETGVPLCACPEIARGGIICHHMILHAVRFGSGDDTT